MKKHEASIQRLNTVPYPTCLDPTVLATIADRCQRKWFRRGQPVFMEGEPCQHLYTLESGRVKCYRMNADGREQIVKVFDRPGDTFCIPSAFYTGRHIVTAKTVTGTWLHLLDIETVKHLAEANPSVLLGLLASAGDQMKSLVVLAGDLAFKDSDRAPRQITIRTGDTGTRAAGSSNPPPSRKPPHGGAGVTDRHRSSPCVKGLECPSERGRHQTQSRGHQHF